MKEFKMKAWLKKENKMVAIIGIDLNYQYIRYTDDGNLFKDDYKIADFKDIELLQFTGTKDKAGQELYEADVILFNDGIDDIYGLISYDDDEGTYRVSMEKICKWCSNYNKGKCTILNEKLYPDVPSSYWGTLDIITKFFDNHFRRFLDPNDLYDLADELSDEINDFVIKKSEATTIELGYEQQEDFSCKYWR